MIQESYPTETFLLDILRIYRQNTLSFFHSSNSNDNLTPSFFRNNEDDISDTFGFSTLRLIMFDKKQFLKIRFASFELLPKARKSYVVPLAKS